MAVALLRQWLSKRGQPAVVISAGTLNLNGQRAAKFARSAIAELGPEFAAHIDEHRSQGIAPALLEMADHLVIMSPRHEDFILRLAPHLRRRLVRLWTYSDDPAQADGIVDPVGQGAAQFRACRDVLIQSLGQWLLEILPEQS